MTGFEPGSSGIGSDRSTNRATSTAHGLQNLLYLSIERVSEISTFAFFKLTVRSLVLLFTRFRANEA